MENNCDTNKQKMIIIFLRKEAGHRKRDIESTEYQKMPKGFFESCES